MSAKKSEETLIDVADAYSKTEHFINENGKRITTIFLALIGVLLAYFAYKKFIVEPKSEEASQMIWKAEYYYGIDSLNLALNGDPQGNYGFLDIIDEYGGTPSGELAKQYAGVIYMNIGDPASALQYLEDASFDDIMLESARLGAIGDAYVELGDYSSAVGSFKDAVAHGNNEFNSPVYLKKMGLAYEAMGDYGNALSAYEQIKEEYPKSSIARDIDRYIAKAAAYIGG